MITLCVMFSILWIKKALKVIFDCDCDSMQSEKQETKTMQILNKDNTTTIAHTGLLSKAFSSLYFTCYFRRIYQINQRGWRWKENVRKLFTFYFCCGCYCCRFSFYVHIDSISISIWHREFAYFVSFHVDQFKTFGTDTTEKPQVKVLVSHIAKTHRALRAYI